MAISKIDDILGINLFDNPFVEEKKDELLKEGIIRFQAPLDLNIFKELNIYHPIKNEVIFLDYTVYVTDYGYLMQIQDITESKRAEEELFEDKEKYKSLFENSMDAVLLTIPDGSILAANPAAEEMFGYSEEEICKLGRNRLVDTADPRLTEGLKEREHMGEFKGELTFIRSDGSKFEGDVSTSIFKDKNSNERTVMIIRDITERKNAEEGIVFKLN